MLCLIWTVDSAGETPAEATETVALPRNSSRLIAETIL